MSGRDDVAVEVHDLGKRYSLGGGAGYRSLRDAIVDASKRLFRRGDPGPRQDEIWALRHFDLTVAKGEVIGVIGRNGSGKSTLLKLLSRITEPTEGGAHVHGRVASLLEVGTGFHPELTGRENVYLNGAILGMSRAEIDSQFDHIVEFAGIREFLDTPVKRYSSGMAVRLAFAVAAHLQPEILIVDEVLAVGDIEFQRKCLGKMSDVATSGRTVIVVSHQMTQIRRLCNRVVWLDRGEVRLIGDTHAVVSAYETASREGSSAIGPGDERTDGQFLRWYLEHPTTGEHVHQIDDLASPVTVHFEASIARLVPDAMTGVALSNSDGQNLWGTAHWNVTFDPGLHRITYKLPYLPLKPGAYRWKVSIWGPNGNVDLWEAEPALLLATTPTTGATDEWAGLLNLSYQFSVDRCTTPVPDVQAR